MPCSSAGAAGSSWPASTAVLYFAEAFVVHDWNSLFFPSFNYVTSGAAFYAVRAASALLALGVVAVMTRRRPERLPESEPPVEALDEEDLV